MQNRGSILMISLWIMAILVIFALGLGHRASLSLRLSSYQRDRLKADYLANSGINRAIEQLKKDTNGYDSLSETWSTGKDAKGNLFLKDAKISQDYAGTFTIGYLQAQENNQYWCMQDEERKININATTAFDKNKISALLNNKQVESADKLTDVIINWISPDSQIEVAKKERFKVSEELLLALEYFYQGQDARKVQNAFSMLKGLITTYTDGRINLNTASLEVIDISIQALLKTTPIESLTPADPENLLTRIMRFREAEGIFDREDPADIIAKLNGIDTPLNDGQKNIITQLVSNNLVTVRSNNFRIEAAGKVGNVTKNITAIYSRQNQKIVYWHEN